MNNMDRLARKFETLRLHVPKPVVDTRPNAQVGFVAFGTSHYAVEESRDQLRTEYGIETELYPPESVPFYARIA